MREKYLGLLSLILATLVGSGFLPILIRYSLDSFHPVFINFVRALLTLSILSTILVIHSPSRKVEKSKIWQVILVLGCGLGVNILFFTTGLAHTTIVASQLIFALLPITVPFVAYFLFKEAVQSQKILGGVVAILGVLVMVVFSSSTAERLALGTVYGNSIILVAVTAYTIYLASSKSLSRFFSPITLSFLTYVGVTAFLFPVALYTFFSSALSSEIKLHSVIALLLLGVASVLLIYFQQFGIKRVSSATTAITVLLGPQFGAIAGTVLFHERFSVILILSMVIVLVGVGISLMGESKSLWQKTRNWYLKQIAKLSGFTS